MRWLKGFLQPLRDVQDAIVANTAALRCHATQIVAECQRIAESGRIKSQETTSRARGRFLGRTLKILDGTLKTVTSVATVLAAVFTGGAAVFTGLTLMQASYSYNVARQKDWCRSMTNKMMGSKTAEFKRAVHGAARSARIALTITCEDSGQIDAAVSHCVRVGFYQLLDQFPRVAGDNYSKQPSSSRPGSAADLEILKKKYHRWDCARRSIYSAVLDAKRHMADVKYDALSALLKSLPVVGEVLSSYDSRAPEEFEFWEEHMPFMVSRWLPIQQAVVAKHVHKEFPADRIDRDVLANRVSHLIALGHDIRPTSSKDDWFCLLHSGAVVRDTADCAVGDHKKFLAALSDYFATVGGACGLTTEMLAAGSQAAFKSFCDALSIPTPK